MPETVDQVTQQVLKSQFCSAEQVQEALDIQQKMRDMGINPKPLPEVLLDKGYISKEQYSQLAVNSRSDKASIDKDSIPGYEILNKIGQGGMGAVFRARQLSMDRIVALKVLPPRLARDQNFRERFMREARAVAKLNHENIIQGIDVGAASGLYFFVMEFVDGKPVSRLMGTDGALPEAKALSICAQIARALEHANRHKMVHRDVKPENIMLTSEGVAKLCDLGLAKQESGDVGLTQAGLSVGTPSYISPEQARGEGDVDVRSDIYSLGASLYHMLAARVPFEGTVPSVVMTKHITEDLVPPKVHRPEISDAANAIVVKAMQKRREDRYQEPAQMAADLEAAAAGKPLIHARVASAPRKAAPGAPSSASGAESRRQAHLGAPARNAAPPGKRPSAIVPIAIGLVAAVAILGGVFAMTRGKKHPDPPPAPAGTPAPDPGAGSVEPPPDKPPVDVNADREKKIEEEFKALVGFIELKRSDPTQHHAIEERIDEFIAAHKRSEWENRAIAEQRKYRDGMDKTAAALLDRIRTEIEPIRRDGRYFEAISTARARWLGQYDSTATAKKYGELLADIDAEILAAWAKDRDAAKALMDRKDYEKALASLDGVKAYASPSVLAQAETLRTEIRRASEAYTASLVEIGRRRYDTEFWPALEKMLRERRYKDALSLCGKMMNDAEMVAVRDRVSKMIGDITSLNTLFADAAQGADVAVKTKDMHVVIRKVEIRITGREGDRVLYSFPNGGSGEISIPRADEDDLAALCLIALNALPPDKKTAQRGSSYFQFGLLFYFTPDEKDKKRAAEEFEKAAKEGVQRAKFYLDLLAEKGMGESELAAKKLYDQAFEAFNAKQYAEAKGMFQKLLSDYGATAWVKERRDAITQRIAECDGKMTGTDTSGLQRVIKGKVVTTYASGAVEVKYDFSKADQLEDWTALDGTWVWDKDAQALHGTAPDSASRGMRWAVPFTGDLSIEMDITPLSDRNIGVTIHNNGGGQAYMAVFGGVFTPAIMGTIGNPDLKSAALVKWNLQGQPPFSILNSAADPKAMSGQTMRVRISRAKKTLSLYVGGKKVIEGQDDAFTQGQISLFLMGSEARFDEITIYGTPDDKWLKNKLGGK